MPAGRPTVRTPDIDRKIEEVAAYGATIEEIAFYVGVHRSTMYRWMAEDKELKDRIDELQQKPILKARETVVKSLSNPVHAFTYLAKKKKDEFGQSVDITSLGKALIPEKTDKEMADKAIAEFIGKHPHGDDHGDTQ